MRKSRKRSKMVVARRGKEREIADKHLLLAQERCEWEEKLHVLVKAPTKKYKGMVRTYFKRFCWEVEQRKADLVKERTHHLGHNSAVAGCVFHDINPKYLKDPVVDGEQKSVYLGQGSFSIVKGQMYRGMKVAVKEFLPRCVKDDGFRRLQFYLICATRTYLCYSEFPAVLSHYAASCSSMV